MQSETITALRTRIAALEHASPALPFGLVALNAALPGGLALGAVHELFAGGPAVEHGAAPALSAPSAAATRWRITGLPSAPPLPHAPDVPGLGRPLWRLELLRGRGGTPASQIVEGPDAQGRLAVPAHLADRPLAPARPRGAAGAAAAGRARA